VEKKKKNIFVRLFKYMGVFKITMLIAVVFAAVSAVINLKAFVCVYGVAKELLGCRGDYSLLNKDYMVDQGWKAVFFISQAFCLYGMGLLFSHITAFNTVARIRIKLIEHIGKLPLGYHSVNPSGKQRKIIEKNTDNLEVLIAHQIPDCVQAAVLPIAFLTFMFKYDWRLSLSCLIPIIMGFAILGSMLKGESKDFVQQYQKSAEDISNAATEYVRGISVVKVFGQTAKSFKRYQNSVKEYSDYLIKYALSMEKSDSIYNTIINGIFFFLIPTAIVLFNAVRDKEKMLLSFVFFAVLTPLIVSILSKIMKSSSNVMISSASLDVIDGIFAEEELKNTGTIKEIEHYDIELDNVTFSYEKDAEKALDNVSLKIKEGTVTALVGESGGGKSTVANLIARFWDVEEGAVKVDGKNIKDIDFESWMGKVSIVFQETNMFKMSILDNVAFYKPEASREEIMRALKLAQCDDIIEKLPNGVDTVIGTKGVYLSGGEMQRLALARAILKDSPVILLDEATAFADAENEYLIQKALDELLKGRTVLMIAHRLSTIVNADQICVFEKGKIVERGTHKELLEKKGMYSNMYDEYANSISWKIGGKK
jgi:ATP-binding cassette subfamily B protein